MLPTVQPKLHWSDENHRGPPISSLRPTTYTVARKFIRDRTARIGVIGLGRVGLPLAMRLSRAGFVVQGFDLDAASANKTQLKQTYLHELFPHNASKDRYFTLNVTSDLSMLSEADVAIISLPVIPEEIPEPDLHLFRETAFGVASSLHAGQLIVVESPTDPGMTEEVVVPILESANDEHLRVSRNTGAPDEVFVGVTAANEEVQKPGINPHELLKVVAGVDTLGMELTAELYSAIFGRVVPLPCPTKVEILKLLEWMRTIPSSKGRFRTTLEHLCQLDSVSENVPAGSGAKDQVRDARNRNVPIDPFYLMLKQGQLGYRFGST